jgi:hypothetical protein
VNQLRLLRRNEVDIAKWDNCVRRAAGYLPYANSWYLDSVAENWDALVMEDYKAVMPLTWLRKLGIKVLYQPYYCQQLGVFSPGELHKAVLTAFFQAATKSFPYIDINLNPLCEPAATTFGLTKKKNLLLKLDKSYEGIKKGFSKGLLRNIAKAERASLEFFESTDLASFQHFYLQNINPEQQVFKPLHKRMFNRISTELLKRGIGKIYVAAAGQDWLAALMLIEENSRHINIINTSSVTGKSQQASHFLFSKVIQKFSGNDITLDFEGSSIPSIARFYEGFGPNEEYFYHLHTTLVKRISQRIL